MSKISKVVIPAAGLGTRLLSATKEQPKEMLPIFSGSTSGELSVKPVVQVIFEQLYEVGIREFYFVVGRNKRAVEDHFTADFDYVQSLEKKSKLSQAKELEAFYKKLSSSIIVWINQAQPQGFGHAVLLTKKLVDDENFLVHAGDTTVFSQKNRHITDIIDLHFSNKNSCTMLVKKVKNPKQYGVVEGVQQKDFLQVTNIEEKPVKPKTDLAVMPIYVFDPLIFEALEKITAGIGNEIQLTDGIKKILTWNHKVVASKLLPSDLWIDVGTPETYWQAQSATYQRFKASQ